MNRQNGPQSRYGLGEVPPQVQLISPVATSRTGSHAMNLPLNLIARIVAQLDEIGDIARVTRTSRLLYYMTLPLLYERVALHSYPDIRYIDGRPEGFGSGSPFTMALNGLVTKAHAGLVQEFRLWGHWREVCVDEFSKGRIPDTTMMLNILLRAATDRMTKLKRFIWELDCKPLKTLYHGLAAHDTLNCLILKFPSTRIPRPSVLIPPMPHLRRLKVTDIDPLCYPDDISLLILHGRKLEDVRIHFSPRMRREAEPGLNLGTYFGRLEKANLKLPVRHFGIQNFFGVQLHVLEEILDPERCKSMASIDTFGTAGGPPGTVFVDETWKNVSPDSWTDFRRVRCNEITQQHVGIISRATGMAQLYFINQKPPKTGTTPIGLESPFTPEDVESPGTDSLIQQLGRDYLHAITRNHGTTLTHLLLSDKWSYSQEEAAEFIRFCPNLEQLGIALNTSNHSLMRLVLPFLSKLKAIRILQNSWLDDHNRMISDEERMEGMRRDLWKAGAESLQWIGFGNSVYKVGKNYQIVNEAGLMEMRREVRLASSDEIKDVELWSMDSLSLDADPIASSST
ncbi:Hypothetical protein R9X50_00233700 [Acrodontium crateriforme]|uniref:Uncharacterized protein n=1 Tax=Acrodontium crateriforme TaxID=150365 RepID=A0AAQ3M1B6_9PEZI|nr:Hypothetical protein R9X50_00233700 [Acrodontium crateriforme]